MPRKDIIIVTLPGTLVRMPMAAPALLKASIEQVGFTCKTLDFNIIFYNTVTDVIKLTELENFFSTGLNNECVQEANELISQWATEIISYNPVYVGISVFTYQNRIATRMLCEYLRKHSDIKIILGGQGLTDGGILGPQGFAKELILTSLADYYIKSEGENSLVELLKGNLDYPGINKDDFKQIDDLDSIPFPNYDDYNFEIYDRKTLPITASRGCVRSCSFCDIHDHWRYKYRSGLRVAEEMIYLHERYQVDSFNFTDSLVNGGLTEFKTFCQAMMKYNQRGHNIKWAGQYIIRSSNHLDEEYWYNLSQSGANNLAIGVETGSDQVREHMNKKFSNEDLDYTMKMLEKYNITCTFLMIIGYPTETEYDFQLTLDMFKKYQHLANKIIIDVSFGSTLGILPGTPLYNQASEFNIELDKHENNWMAHNNPTLTLSERIRRVNKIKEYVADLGYTFNNSATGMLHILEQNIPLFEKRNKIKKIIKLKEQK
jgi:hypothetical protein